MIDGRRNSLNALRLFFAVTVIVSHAAGFGVWTNHFPSPFLNHRTTWGGLAVLGFFGISGYLIAQSAENNHVGRYLWQRFLRIFPGFWFCLILVVLFFGVVGWDRWPHHLSGCGLSCYVQHRGVPFFFQNAYLRGYHGRWSPIPNTGVANGSLWTLYYEFLCYLLMAGLAVVGLLRRRAFVLVLAACCWVIELLCIYMFQIRLPDADAMLAFVPVFLSGALIYLYRDRLPDSGRMALMGTGLFLIGFFIPTGALPFPSPVDMTSVFAVYPVLWLGAHLPLQRVGAKNDYSYGMYLYGFLMSGLLNSLWTVGRSWWGFPAFALASVLGTVPFAVLSWWAIEKPALRLKKAKLLRLRPSPSLSREPSLVR